MKNIFKILGLIIVLQNISIEIFAQTLFATEQSASIQLKFRRLDSNAGTDVGADENGFHFWVGGFDGNMNGTFCFKKNGTAQGNSWTSFSDKRFKINIIPLMSSLSKVMILQPVTYNWNIKEFSNRGFTSDIQIGFIAQDVQKLFPELVATGTDGYLSLDYAKVTPILVKSIQEQQVIINEMKEQIALMKEQNVEMKASIENLKKGNTSTASTNQ
jgi:hypothetical protein